ncbi:hypothetical protein [Aquitalea magnusonii]|uniref:hypothetical protein n=1 Tax=Aquitalea magnusonii TaxID=332411 RepID=UPI00128EEE03|nr:hypothetical protein [Aquitalea magnusonii]
MSTLRAGRRHAAPGGRTARWHLAHSEYLAAWRRGDITASALEAALTGSRLAAGRSRLAGQRA